MEGVKIKSSFKLGRLGMPFTRKSIFRMILDMLSLRVVVSRSNVCFKKFTLAFRSQ